MVDAHAGALAALGGLDAADRLRRAALIAGTSNCVMVMSPRPVGAPGLWGPFRDVGLPGDWLTEGGQSTAGALLDLVCRIGGGAPDPALHDRIAARIAKLRAAEGWDLAAELHVLPDLRGNRSPQADARALGAISGLGLDGSFDGLCRLYWRAAVGIALGLADVVDALRRAGSPIERLHATGGHVRNPMLMELYATAAGVPVEADETADAVLLGAAMTAAVASGLHPGPRRRRPAPCAAPAARSRPIPPVAPASPATPTRRPNCAAPADASRRSPAHDRSARARLTAAALPTTDPG